MRTALLVILVIRLSVDHERKSNGEGEPNRSDSNSGRGDLDSRFHGNDIFYH